MLPSSQHRHPVPIAPSVCATQSSEKRNTVLSNRTGGQVTARAPGEAAASQIAMDRVFARCVDLVALAGPSGLSLLDAVTHAVGPHPRPALLHWLAAQFTSRHPHFFHVSNPAHPPHKLYITAPEPLRRRALGYSLLEHAPLQHQAWHVLETVGRAGSAGVLQSNLARLVSLTPVMLHHYLGSLAALQLVARRKIVLTSSRQPDSTALPEHAASDAPQAPSSVVYTSVVVLARFASQIGNSCSSMQHSDENVHTSSSSDAEFRARVSRVLSALKESPAGLLPQRELKLIAFPDSDRPPSMSPEVYAAKRHRMFRTLREKLQRAKLVLSVTKACVDDDGKPQGNLLCFQLPSTVHETASSSTTPLMVTNKDRAEADKNDTEDCNLANQLQSPSVEHTLEARTPGLLAEVDLSEQIYQLLAASGAKGISVPEITAHLDASTGRTGVLSKRIRNVITAISNTTPTTDVQMFDGSAMHKRIILCSAAKGSRDAANEAGDKMSAQSDGSQANQQVTIHGQMHRQGPKRKGALTTLGAQRIAIVCRLVAERKVIVAESLGREVASIEGSGIHHVDMKVMRRILASVVDSGRARILSVARPSLTEGASTSMMQLLVAPDVTDDGLEIQNFLSKLLDRALNPTPSPIPAIAPRPVKKRRRVAKKAKGDLRTVKKTRPDGEASASLITPVEGGAVGNSSFIMDPISEPNGAESIDTDANGTVATAKLSTTGESAAGSFENAAQSSVLSACETEHESSEHADSVKEALSSEEPIVVRSFTRARLSANPKRTRVSRLCAIDYGWVKEKMHRVRLLHEALYRVFRSSDSDSVDDAYGKHESLVQSTMEAALQAPDIGKCKLQECALTLTVQKYAQIFGLHEEHGEFDKTMLETKMRDAPSSVVSETMSSQAAVQNRALVACLVRLGLIRSAPDSGWVLCGGGLIRDFGKGLPPAVSAHGIVFSSFAAVRAYWDELELFKGASPEAATGGSPDTSESPPLIRHASSKALDTVLEMRIAVPVPDVYYASNWAPKKMLPVHIDEKISMEVVLQQLAGVPSVKRGNSRCLDPHKYIVTPLRRFTVEEIYDHVGALRMGAIAAEESIGRIVNVERLTAYARYRSKHPAHRLVLARTMPSSSSQTSLHRLNGADERKKKRSADVILPSLARMSHFPKRARSMDDRDVSLRGGPSSGTQMDPSRRPTSSTEEEIGGAPARPSSQNDYLLDVFAAGEYGTCPERNAPASHSENRNQTCPVAHPGSVELLVGATKVFALGRCWTSERSLELEPLDAPECKSVCLELATHLKRSTSRCREALHDLREISIIRIAMDTLANRLASCLLSKHDPVPRTTRLDQVPILLPSDVHGDAANIEQILSAVVSEVAADWDRKATGGAGVSTRENDQVVAQRRKFIAAALDISAPDTRLDRNERRLAQLKPKRRLLTDIREHENARFGIIGTGAGDIQAVEHSISQESDMREGLRNGRSGVLELALKIVLSEHPDRYQSEVAVCVLSRFYEEDLKRVRNKLYLQGIISETVDDKWKRLLGLESKFARKESLGTLFSPIAKFEKEVFKHYRGISASTPDAYIESTSDRDKLWTGIHRSSLVDSQIALFGATQTAFFPSGAAKLTITPFLSFLTAPSIATAREFDEAGSAPETELSSVSLKMGVLSDGTMSTVEEHVPMPAREPLNGETCCDDWKKVLASKRKAEDDMLVSLERGEYDLGIDGSRSTDQGLAHAVLSLVKTCGQDGVRASEFGTRISSSQKNWSKDSIVYALIFLLIRGVVHRFAVDIQLDEGDEESRRNLIGRGGLYMLGSVAWEFAVGPICSQGHVSDGAKNIDWSKGRMISVWRHLDGSYHEEFMRDVQKRMVAILMRKPGMEETRLVAEMKRNFGQLTDQAVVDMGFALEKEGLIRRQFVSLPRVGEDAAGRLSGCCTLFSSSGARLTRKALSRPVMKFVDGLAVHGLNGGGVKCFYQAAGHCAGETAEKAMDMDQVGAWPWSL